MDCLLGGIKIKVSYLVKVYSLCAFHLDKWCSILWFFIDLGRLVEQILKTRFWRAILASLELFCKTSLLHFKVLDLYV